MRIYFPILLLLFLPCAVYPQHPESSPQALVYPNRFPASRTCREAPVNAGNCDEVNFATFTLTWSPRPGLVIPRGASIKTTFAYEYNGTYQTEPRYTGRVRWPALQNSEPAGPNYITATITDPGKDIGYRLVVDAEGDPVIHLNDPVGSSAVMRITYGDKTGGGPGCYVPAIAYDIDLVLLYDADKDGIYEPLVSVMPTISVVGTQPDRFGVVAPSTPDSATFEIVVVALQGHDEILQNNYIVPAYTGTIEFSSTDANAVLPPPYRFMPEDNGVKQFTVTLNDNDTHAITVTEQGSVKSGTSNPIIVGETFGSDQKRLYWGVLQQHTNIGGHASQTPQYAYDYARFVSGLDFLSLSEHCSPGLDWDYNLRVADDYYEPGRFVTFGAIEWSRNDYGHRHLVYRDAGASEGHCGCLLWENPTIPCYRTLASMLGSVEGADVLVIPHHMAWNFPGRPGVRDAVLGDINNANQRLYEIYSVHGSSEKFDNAPYPMHTDPGKQWGPEKPVYFQDAIALGYRFGVTAGTDNHTGEPGGHTSGKTSYSRQGLTAVLSDELTRDAVWEALWARRTYGTTGARIILDFTVDGAPMGSELTSTDAPVIKVHTTGTDTIQTVSIIRNGYETAYECHPEAATADVTFVDTDVEGGATSSYYVRVVQTDRHMAWSSPIWVEYLPGKSFEIESLYPNPFNPGMVVRFDLPEITRITAEIYTVTGERVATIADKDFPAGINEISWDGVTRNGGKAASGVYFVRLESRHGVLVRKVVLLR